MPRTTHTLALIELPSEIVDLIRDRMMRGGYEHAVFPEDRLLDMTGIGITDQPIDGTIPRPAPEHFSAGAERGLPPLEDLDERAADAIALRPDIGPNLDRDAALASCVRFCRGVWPVVDEDFIDWTGHRFTRAEFQQAAQGRRFE
jgi:hypothetical protein